MFSCQNSCGGGLITKLYPAFATPWPVAHQAPFSKGFPVKNAGVG